MSNQLKGRLWLMGFGLNLSAAIIHGILHNYFIAGISFVFSYVTFEAVVRNYIDKVVEDESFS